MRIKCPCCNYKFAVTEDDILLDYETDYDSKIYVWENLPLLRSSWDYTEGNDVDFLEKN